MRTYLLATIGLALLALFASSALAAAPTVVYVSATNDKQVLIYALDEAAGVLKQIGQVELPGTVRALTVDPQRRFLFVSVRSTRQIASFRIDPQTGGLERIGLIDAGIAPTYFWVANQGRLLMTAAYAEGKVATYAIQEDGALQPEPLTLLTTTKTAHCIVTDPQERFAYVPHPSPNAIFQYALNPQSGQLTPLSAPRAAASQGAGPRHLFFHPGGAWAYSSDESGSSCSLWRFDAKTGNLTSEQTVSTLPELFDGRNTCADVEVHPNGKFVYVSNRGYHSIATFAVDEKTGRLSSLGQTPTEETPRSFNISPDGKLMIVAGESSHTLAVYRLDPTTGGLTKLNTYETGKGPVWVQVVPLPTK